MLFRKAVSEFQVVSGLRLFTLFLWTDAFAIALPTLLTDQQSYSAAEEVARAAQVGLWRHPDPMPHWEFRH